VLRQDTDQATVIQIAAGGVIAAGLLWMIAERLSDRDGTSAGAEQGQPALAVDDTERESLPQG
jgi:hypothetical protein